MVQAFVKDSGYQGQIKSLAGIPGAIGMGLILGYESVALTTSEPKQIMQANPTRKWANIQNINPADITIFFGDVGAAGVSGIRLTSLGSYEINELNPWTGAMTGFQDSGATINLFVIEASVQP